MWLLIIGMLLVLVVGTAEDEKWGFKTGTMFGISSALLVCVVLGGVLIL